MSLKQKITISVVGVVLLVILLSGIHIWLVESIEGSVDNIQGNLPGLIALGKIKVAGLGLAETAFAIGVDDFAPLTLRDLLAHERQEFDTRQQQLDESIATLETLPFIDSVTVGEIRRLSQSLEELVQESFAIASANHSPVDIVSKLAEIELAEELFEEFMDSSLATVRDSFTRMHELVNAQAQNGLIIVVVMGCLFVALALALAARFSTVVISPLQKLNQAAQEVGQGNFAFSIDVQSKDELAVLAQTFNQMTHELQKTTISRDYFEGLIASMRNLLIVLTPDYRIELVNQATIDALGYSRAQLIGLPLHHILVDQDLSRFGGTGPAFETFYVARDNHQIPVSVTSVTMKDNAGQIQRLICVAEDITERQLAQTELVENEALQIELKKTRELSDFKTRFMAMVSHEFRTPLAIIATSSHILKEHQHKLDPDRIREHTERLGDQVQRLKRMLDDVTEAMKAETTELPFNPGWIDIEGICEEIVSDMKNSIALYHNIAFRYEQQVGPVYADKVLMQRIVTNLLSNAIKYSDKGKEVRLSVFMVGQEVILQITDQGIGIPLDEQKYLFQPYFRARNIGAVGGTGLGLKLVKDAVELHNGRIEVDSRQGQGTTFRVVLPHSNPLQPSTSQPIVADDIDQLVDSQNCRATGSH